MLTALSATLGRISGSIFILDGLQTLILEMGGILIFGNTWQHALVGTLVQ